jgi:hypothetical protein
MFFEETYKQNEKEKSGKPFMVLTCSYAIVIILIGLFLANFLWFFLLPAKGEEHPTVKAITELERTIKRSEDLSDANWGVMRKQIQKQKMELSFLKTDQYMTYKDLQDINNLIESLYLFVNGNWRLLEMSDEPEIAKRLYNQADEKLELLKNKPLKFKIQLNPKKEEFREIDISDSAKELKNLIRDQLQFIEEQYGV